MIAHCCGATFVPYTGSGKESVRVRHSFCYRQVFTLLEKTQIINLGFGQNTVVIDFLCFRVTKSRHLLHLRGFLTLAHDLVGCE